MIILVFIRNLLLVNIFIYLSYYLLGLSFLETSAADSTNVDKAFKTLIVGMYIIII